ncbi:hypothetical protein SKAU_G00380280, partial [Synaphobranchus kaupii]
TCFRVRGCACVCVLYIFRVPISFFLHLPPHSLTYMCRAGAIRTDDNCIILKTLPCLVRMCSKERLLEERVEGAETLAYLMEPDVELQRIASVTDHLVAMLADYFKYPSSVSAITDIKRLDHDLKHAHELRQAAFKLYASLGANDEDIRKKITETENMMGQNRQRPIGVQHQGVYTVLSRSVQQLRTSFHDHAVWKPLMKLLQNAPDEVLVMASSTLCNLLLEFSPSKEPILESGVIELLCSLTQSDSPALRVNGIWALMNMAFQADQKVKVEIVRALGTEQLFRLLSDPDPNVLMKTLGLLRNLLSTRPHIDQIMSSHGKQIMQAVTPYPGGRAQHRGQGADAVHPGQHRRRQHGQGAHHDQRRHAAENQILHGTFECEAAAGRHVLRLQPHLERGGR